MDSLVQFRSAAFPRLPAEGDPDDDPIFGQLLADDLAEKLQRSGVATGEIAREDWGFLIPIGSPFKMWIGCSHQQGDEQDFMCFFGPEKFLRRASEGKNEAAAELAGLRSVVDAILRTNPAVDEIAWQPQRS